MLDRKRYVKINTAFMKELADEKTDAIIMEYFIWNVEEEYPAESYGDG